MMVMINMIKSVIGSRCTDKTQIKKQILSDRWKERERIELRKYPGYYTLVSL